MKKPKVLYAFWANTFGPSFDRPQKVVYVKDIDKWWCYKDRDCLVEKIGLTDEGWICFAHPDKQRVQDFANGFNAARKIMRDFCVDAEQERSE